MFVEHLSHVRACFQVFVAVRSWRSRLDQPRKSNLCSIVTLTICSNPSPKSQVFQLALAIDHLISKNPVVQVLINSSLVLVEYAPLLPACQCMLSTFAIVQVCKFNLHQTACCFPFQDPTRAPSWKRPTCKTCKVSNSRSVSSPKHSLAT